MVLRCFPPRGRWIFDVLVLFSCNLLVILQEITAGGKGNFESAVHEGIGDDIVTAFEEVKKDLNALSKEEQMDVVFRYFLS